MSKQTAISQVPGPTIAPPSQAPARAPLVTVPPQSGGERLVVEWSNDQQDAGMTSDGAQALTVDTDTGNTRPSAADDLPAKGIAAPPVRGETPERGKDGKFQPKTPAEQAVEGDGSPPVEDVGTAVPVIATPSEKRQAALAALASERKARELEASLKREQTERATERAEYAKVQKAIKEGTVSDFLALRGMSRDDLEEMIIRGDKALEGVPKERPKVADPEVAELRDTVKALKDKLDARERSDQEATQRQVLEHIETATKDMDIPVTRAVDNGMALVLNTAHELWLKGGSKGKVAEHLPEAAKRAEAYFRNEKPHLAKLADAARKAETGEREDPPPVARSIGRRQAPAPAPAKTKSLWTPGPDGQMPTREEVDAQIKRELNFKDRV